MQHARTEGVGRRTIPKLEGGKSCCQNYPGLAQFPYHQWQWKGHSISQVHFYHLQKTIPPHYSVSVSVSLSVCLYVINLLTLLKVFQYCQVMLGIVQYSPLQSNIFGTTQYSQVYSSIQHNFYRFQNNFQKHGFLRRSFIHFQGVVKMTPVLTHLAQNHGHIDLN